MTSSSIFLGRLVPRSPAMMTMMAPQPVDEGTGDEERRETEKGTPRTIIVLRAGEE